MSKEAPPFEDERRITVRRDSDVAMAGILAVQVNLMSSSVDRMEGRLEEVDNKLTGHIEGEQKFFQRPVIQFLEKTDRLWVLLNHIADGILKSCEKISAGLTWGYKNILPIIGAGLFVWVWIHDGLGKAWHQLKDIFQ